MSPVVRAYDGAARVSRPGEERALTALRELTLAGRRLPERTRPVGYAADDHWDPLLLPEALAFDADVDRTAEGVALRYGVEPRDVAFYAGFVPLPPEAGALVAQAVPVSVDGGRLFGPPSDALVLLLVARAVADRQRVELVDALRQVLALRGEGARWGIVALATAIDTAAFAATVDQAVLPATAAPG